MKEDIHVRQIQGERTRRWFSSKDFDLIIWNNADHSFAGFELCYDKMSCERSIDQMVVLVLSVDKREDLAVYRAAVERLLLGR